MKEDLYGLAETVYVILFGKQYNLVLKIRIKMWNHTEVLHRRPLKMLSLEISLQISSSYTQFLLVLLK